MSRLGDLIHTERTRQGMTAKQVGKMCGVSESFILAVEKGTRIIADDQARRILKKIGLREQTEADFSLDDIATTVDLAQASPSLAGAAAKKSETKAAKVHPVQEKDAEVVASTDDGNSPGVAGSVWLDALSQVVKRVPVLNAVMKPVDYKLLPVMNGQIEGAKAEKVYYFLAPDDSMRGFRIHAGDIALMVPAGSPVDGAIMLVEWNSHRYLRKIKRLNDTQLLLQSYDREYNAETVSINDVTFLSRAVVLEIQLQ